MSGATAGGNATAKLQEDTKPEIDPAKISLPPSQPNILEEDDEFEDFPVEGELSESSDRSLASVAALTYRSLSRLDARRSRSTRRQRTPLGGELG